MGSKQDKNKQLNSSGQIIVEYILLLIIAVGVAAIIISTMVSRDRNDPGFLIRKWDQIINFIGQDRSDDINREEAPAN